MPDLDYQASKLHQQRDDTVSRRAALLGPLDSELEREQTRQRRTRRSPIRWAGIGMAVVGRRLTALGERLAPPQHDHPQTTA